MKQECFTLGLKTRSGGSWESSVAFRIWTFQIMSTLGTCVFIVAWIRSACAKCLFLFLTSWICSWYLTTPFTLPFCSLTEEITMNYYNTDLIVTIWILIEWNEVHIIQGTKTFNTWRPDYPQHNLTRCASQQFLLLASKSFRRRYFVDRLGLSSGFLRLFIVWWLRQRICLQYCFFNWNKWSCLADQIQLLIFWQNGNKISHNHLTITNDALPEHKMIFFFIHQPLLQYVQFNLFKSVF